MKIKNFKRRIKLLSGSVSQNYHVNVRVYVYNWSSETFSTLNLFIANGFLYSLHSAIYTETSQLKFLYSSISHYIHGLVAR